MPSRKDPLDKHSYYVEESSVEEYIEADTSSVSMVRVIQLKGNLVFSTKNKHVHII